MPLGTNKARNIVPRVTVSCVTIKTVGPVTFTNQELAHASAYIVRVVDEQFGGNQSAAAAAFGCSPSTLNRIKNGRRKPGTLVSGVARALGVSVDEVLGHKRPVSETRAEDAPQQQTILTDRYPYRADVLQALVDDGIAKRDAERAVNAAVAFDEGEDGSNALHLYRLARQLLAAAKGKATGERILEE
jgi:DNA-binding transcriptional regulator YdaS (Cro superfamily)